ncbi:MAG: PQQ-like beta-propeller repeat protein [Sedimentisphaerales bacterium]|nr:PQQ-like beta-propeller repeat protein [Sedimentisphaerales bacterium]
MLSSKQVIHWSGRFVAVVGMGWLVFISIVGVGCESAPTPVNTAPPPARVAGILLDQLRQAGLNLQWSTSVPLGRSGKLQQLFYHDQTLYALTGNNVLYAFSGKNGLVKWSTIIAEDDVVCSRPSWHQGFVLFVVKDQVVEVRKSDGGITRKINLNFSPTTNAVRSEKYLYVGSEKRQFYCIRLADEVPVWQAISNEPPIGAVAVDQEHCYFTRSDGRLYVSMAERRELVWSADMKGNSPGVLVDAGQCLLPSEDTALYCFDAATGEPLWKHLSGAALVDLPAVTAKAVYQPVKHRSLLCLNRASGSLHWELPDGVQLLSENGAVAYALTRSGEIAMMDNNTGQRRLALPVASLSLCAENTEDATIFLSTRAGDLVALTPENVSR